MCEESNQVPSTGIHIGVDLLYGHETKMSYLPFGEMQLELTHVIESPGLRFACQACAGKVRDNNSECVATAKRQLWLQARSVACEFVCLLAVWHMPGLSSA